MCDKVVVKDAVTS